VQGQGGASRRKLRKGCSKGPPEETAVTKKGSLDGGGAIKTECESKHGYSGGKENQGGGMLTSPGLVLEKGMPKTEMAISRGPEVAYHLSKRQIREETGRALLCVATYLGFLAREG